MNNAVEKYLQHVARRLWLLPRQLREAEIAELREHICALIADYQAGGMSETAATQAALEQFGMADQLGRELRQAWFSYAALRRVLGRALFIYGCSVLIVFSFLAFTMNQPTDITPQLSHQMMFALLLPLPTMIVLVMRALRHHTWH